MSNWNPRVNSLFLNALELSAGRGRDEFLRRECAGNAELHAQVLALLDASDRAGNFLETSAGRPTRDDRQELRFERPGDVIGPYKLLQEIGQGGMGIVFIAEQTTPVRRVVALKIIQSRYHSQQVVARFEAERQALALMDHPNIARVLDAGTIDRNPSRPISSGGDAASMDDSLRTRSASCDGQCPYLVMELVDGLPITEYCDQQKLTVRERLQLFIPVCQAVQHAHQKGIIHRDLKPSNILILQIDGKPTPKIIDFGVAKAIGPKLTDKTLVTEYGSVLGTLEYMSPEQAELNQLDVDTRSDVYSLGVLLYELITGTTPLDRSRKKTTSLLEVLRIIREEEPVRPSVRLSSLSHLPETAARYGTELARLKRQIKGDLDWIVMKAIDKDRRRRYETANGLARDLERFLADEPVEARPPSAAYRFSKFAQRNRGPVVAGAIVVTALLAGIAVSTWQAIRATRAEHSARASAAEAREAYVREAAQRTTAEDRLSFLLLAAGADARQFDNPEIAAIIDRWSDDAQGVIVDAPDAKATLLLTVGRAFVRQRQYPKASRSLEQCLELAHHYSVVEEAKYLLAHCRLRQGEVKSGTQMLRELLELKLQRHSAPAFDELRATWPGLSDAGPKPSDVPGQAGLALDGKRDFVVLPNLQFDGRPPWTLEIIVRADEVGQSASRDPSGWTSLVSTHDGGGIGIDTKGGRWAFELYSPSKDGDAWLGDYAGAVADKPPVLNVWMHIAGVWDGSELRLYIDGQVASRLAGVEECESLSEGPFFIGADPADLESRDIAEGFLHGIVRAVRISHGVEYTDDFTPPERLECTPKTLALYDFTIDTGRYAIDRSGHGCHGIILGANFVPASDAPRAK